MEEDTNISAGHKFIFNDNFYNDLDNKNSALPPQRDMLAPIGERNEAISVVIPKVEEEKPEVLEESNEPIKVDLPSKIEIPSLIDDNTAIVNEEPISVPLEDESSDSVQEMIPVVEPVVEKPAVDLLNVKTGIDKQLEREVLNSVTKEEEKEVYVPPVIQPKQKTVYRAVRRNNVMNNISENISNSQNDNTDVVTVSHVEKMPNGVPQKIEDNWVPPYQPRPIIITEDVNYYEEEENYEVVKSTVLEELAKKANKTGSISILARYGDDFCSHDYITNPAIGRDKEIKDLSLILLTPEKSGLLVGKPGIGKTSIVEGLAYRLQRGLVPEALKGYTIISVKTASLLGSLPNGETRLQTLVDELKDLDKVILFIDEIHMLIEASDDSNLDFANLFKESLGRGGIKMIGATTTEEYERYILTDKAFVRRFQRIDVMEPTPEETVEIILGTIPKIEANTGVKMMYTHYIQAEIARYIVSITSEYKRVYGIGSRYPDICLSLMTQAFSEAIFDNRKEVNIKDIRNAILKSKNIYPDVIKKEIVNFDKQFSQLLEETN